MSSSTTTAAASSSSSTGNKRTISQTEWNSLLSKATVNKQDLDKLVLNYLVVEGYKDAAAKFAAETGHSPGVDLQSIQDRMMIRTAVQSGDIETAIDLVNTLDPEILDSNPKLYFHLQQQRLIELIRSGDATKALAFAQQELAPRGEENMEFLEELEKTMALFAFDSASSPFADLFSPSQRQKTASELNAAILSAQCQEKDPKLPQMLKMLTYSQKQLEEKINFPKIVNFQTGEFEVKMN